MKVLFRLLASVVIGLCMWQFFLNNETQQSTVADSTKNELKQVDQNNPTITDMKPLTSVKSVVKKPRLIIHIGPSKTGTSTIQKESSKYFEALEADDYFYLGKFAPRQRRFPAKIAHLFSRDDCFEKSINGWRETGTTRFIENECWRERVSGIEEYRLKNQSIVLSDEAYSYASNYNHSVDHYKFLHVAFQDWEVLVVPTYRRYFEWVVSVAKEVNHKACHRENIDWNDRKCQKLWSKVNQLRLRNDFEAYPYTSLDVSAPTWRDAGFNVTILNFHSKRHITCSFYCDIIPNAPNACAYCLQQPSERHNLQEASLTAYNEIVYEAAKQGIINHSEQEKRSRFEVTKDLANYHRNVLGKNLKDLPLICPPRNPVLALLNKSLEMEKRLLPEFFRRPEGEEEHRATFWRTADEEKTFCSVDVHPLFKGVESLEQVLRALNTTTNWPAKTKQYKNN